MPNILQLKGTIIDNQIIQFLLEKFALKEHTHDYPTDVGGANFDDTEGDPANVSLSAAADGTSGFAARRDHAHLLSDGPGSGLDADTVDGSHASAFATSGHTHEVDERADMFSDAEGDPANVSTSAAADGVSTYGARRDHVHLLSTTGLDADTVDGSHASAFAAAAHTHAHSALTGVGANDHHNRSHAMTSTSDHTATAWRVFYSDASGNVTELAFGTSGQHLVSNGATAAPSWEDPPSAGSHVLADTTGLGASHTTSGLTAGQVLRATGATTAAFQSPQHGDLTGVGANDHHNRSHTMTSTSDHTATAWRIFYSNASGNVTELALGTSGQHLKSNGAAAAPSWEDPPGSSGGSGDLQVDEFLYHRQDNTTYVRFFGASGDKVAIYAGGEAYLLVEGGATDTVSIGDTATAVTLVTDALQAKSGGKVNIGSNLTVNGDPSLGSATGVIALQNGTAPSSSPANNVQLYSEDVSASAELKVRDEAGNVTTLSPHNFTGHPHGPSEDMAWSYHSERDGRVIVVDMLRVVRLLEELTGEQLVFISEKGEE